MTTRNCGNCGQAFPPFLPEHNGSYVYCSEYQTIKEAGYSCRAWADDSFSAGVAPYWCEPYTKRRLTQDEIDANQTPEAVRMRLNAKENNGTFKRKAAAHRARNEQRLFNPNSHHRIGNSTILQIPVPYKSKKVQLQEQCIEHAWNELERFEAAPPDEQWRMGKEINQRLKWWAKQIDQTPF